MSSSSSISTSSSLAAKESPELAGKSLARIKELSGKIEACEAGQQAAIKKMNELMSKETIFTYARGGVLDIPTKDIKGLKWVNFLPIPTSAEKFVMVDSHNKHSGDASMTKFYGWYVSLVPGVAPYPLDNKTVLNPCDRNDEYNAILGIDYEKLGFTKVGSKFITFYQKDYFEAVKEFA